MPPVQLRGDGRKAKSPKKTLLRLLSYMRKYIPLLLIVLVCIVVTAVAQVTGSEALGKLVDEFIVPMVETGSTDFSPVVTFLVTLGCVFGAGIIASFLQQFLMATISQGTQKVIRDEMFTRMQLTVTTMTQVKIQDARSIAAVMTVRVTMEEMHWGMDWEIICRRVSMSLV